ncbi:membrane protein insertion efficiency factor YidD [Chryseobacterium oryctis]|uniref:Membrane protein insertion efficiency factor YidD n=1 Tax=Chryseobacterium oryctis TaxID=2952618 RepID=A0ABT3HLW6_9FLAO|nr:membrane protein insertion efficiency factor YidD [Chryseobacterium oryctis]MCW3160776.1 membrane protein insertion efficiency factor YidD [Chryseobacterium oryctis]
MKYLLILIIRIYWLIFPPEKRRKCIFKTSCSKYVYQETIEKGIISGLKALKFRFRNCRSTAILHKNPSTNNLQVILPNNQILEEKDISEYLLNKNNYGKIYY